MCRGNPVAMLSLLMMAIAGSQAANAINRTNKHFCADRTISNAKRLLGLLSQARISRCSSSLCDHVKVWMGKSPPTNSTRLPSATNCLWWRAPATRALCLSNVSGSDICGNRACEEFGTLVDSVLKAILKYSVIIHYRKTA
nr:hypothetical protein CFP56_48770 [Quercus suber]